MGPGNLFENVTSNGIGCVRQDMRRVHFVCSNLFVKSNRHYATHSRYVESAHKWCAMRCEGPSAIKMNRVLIETRK